MNFQGIHSYYKMLAIADFSTGIVTEGEEIIPAANKKWCPESGYIYFCTEGSLSILVSDDGLSIGNSVEYMPTGLIERYCPLAKFEYTGSDSMTPRKITCTALDCLFTENHPQRVEALAKALVFMSIFTIDLHNECHQVTSYQAIHLMLYRYLYRRYTHEGESEGLALFIVRHINLPRIYAFRVLADSKAGGYIIVKRGKLISIDRPLPVGY